MKSQGGWVGMVALLLALLVVAWLAKDALTKYGLVPGTQAPKQAGAPDAAPAPANALEAARNLEKSLQQESEKRGGGY
ncbi:MAG: hypothetical protein IT518_04175 [Burkholderiales bacterium]|nr:hypothetical protein [Burkholderiales bacterium]